MEAVSSELVSAIEFPVYQGEYREFCRFGHRYRKMASKTAHMINMLASNSLRAQAGKYRTAAGN